MELREKVCVIAGASGAIGSAVARRFSQEGADLVLSYRNNRPDQLLEELQTGSGRVTAFPFDLCDAQQVDAAVLRIEREFGSIHAVVNCAGIIGPIGPLETSDIHHWAKALETNLLGSVYLARGVLPFMKKRARGKIIFFSGGGAAYGRPYFTAYSSSKAALVRFTESLAQEVVQANIQVNAVAPGPIESQMWNEMRAAGAAGGLKLLDELKKFEETGGASPERATALAVFLASTRSDGLTGRLVSALWDKWENPDGGFEKIAASEAWTLRRVPLS